MNILEFTPEYDPSLVLEFEYSELESVVRVNARKCGHTFKEVLIILDVRKTNPVMYVKRPLGIDAVKFILDNWRKVLDV